MALRLSQPGRQPAAELGGLDRHADELLLDPPADLVVHALRVLAYDTDQVAELDRSVGMRRLADPVGELVCRLDHDRPQALYVCGARGVLEAASERRLARHGRPHDADAVRALGRDSHVVVATTRK